MLVWLVAFAPSEEACQSRHVEAVTMTPSVNVATVSHRATVSLSGVANLPFFDVLCEDTG